MTVDNVVKIKENISDLDLGNVIETVVEFMIRKDNNGYIIYTPYYQRYGLIVGISKYLIEGIKFDKDDDIFDEVVDNESVNQVLNSFINNSKSMQYILDSVTDIVEFRKREFLHDYSDIKERLLKCIEQEKKLNNLNLEIVKKQNKILTQQIKVNEFNEQVMNSMTPDEVKALNDKLLSGEFDMKKVVAIVIDKYLNSEMHRGKEKELIESQQKTIADFSTYKKMQDARNVLADKK